MNIKTSTCLEFTIVQPSSFLVGYKVNGLLKKKKKKKKQSVIETI